MNIPFLRQLIKNGKEPLNNSEYIITSELSYHPPDHVLGDEPTIIPQGTVVNRVVRRDERGGYSFVCIENGLEAHTNYPWALALNTPENAARLFQYWSMIAEMEETRKAINAFLRKIETLEIRD